MNDYPTGLLKKFLDNRCSPEELEQVRLLLQHPENSELLDSLIAGQAAADWEATGYANEELQPTVARWKKQLNERIYRQSGGNVKHLWIRKLRIAAAVIAGVLLLGGIAFRSLKNTVPTYVQQRNPGGVPVKYILPDSTEVHLAAGSQIRYPVRFSENKRVIFLEGEAFFDVKPDPEKPFIIQTGEVHTRVLGTSFRITAFKGALLEVAVATGKVQVTDHQKGQLRELAVLSQGRKVSYNPVNGSVEQKAVDPASLEKWATGEVYFEEQRLDSITDVLQRIYGVELRLEQSTLAISRVSAAFSATEPLESVMEMLAFVGKFQYSYDMEKQLYTLYLNKKPIDKK